VIELRGGTINLDSIDSTQLKEGRADTSSLNCGHRRRTALAEPNLVPIERIERAIVVLREQSDAG